MRDYSYSDRLSLLRLYSLQRRRERYCIIYVWKIIEDFVPNNVTADWIPVISGVPQWSVLGPCLFVMYVNDIDDGVSSKILKFADDTKITASISSVEERNILKTGLTRLMEWSEEWQMKFNVK